MFNTYRYILQAFVLFSIACGLELRLLATSARPSVTMLLLLLLFLSYFCLLLLCLFLCSLLGELMMYNSVLMGPRVLILLFLILQLLLPVLTLSLSVS